MTNGLGVRGLSATAVAFVLMFATTGQYAFADNVQNDVVAGGNDTFTTSGSTTINYRITANNGDGQTGCNAADSSPATVTINVPAGVTAAPGSLGFTSCGTNKPVVFSSSTAGNYEITVSVSDSGTGTYNTNPAKFTLHVIAPANTAPAIIVPGDQNVEGNTANGANADYSSLSGELSANDNEDGDISSEIECSPVSGSFFALGGPYEITCTVEDSQGEIASDTFEITVVDTTDPEITVPSDISAEATGPSGASVLFSVTASDIVDADVDVSCEDQDTNAVASGDSFSLGTVIVTCNALDDSGNEASDSFDITVVDTTAPQLSLPLDITNEATGPGGATVSFSATATDLVDGDLPVDCTPASGSEFSLGTTPVSCSATDMAGNTATSGFNIIVEDTTAPVLSLPDEITEEATGPDGATVTFSATASDIVDGAVTVFCDPASGSTFALGDTTVDCEAEDNAGNKAMESFTVKVEDTTPPTLALPGDMIVEATGPTGALATFSASASDLVDGSTTVNCTPESGSTFALGETTVNCSTTDNAGNTASGSFMVTVVDTTPPTLDLSDNISVHASGISGALVTYSASATDLVDGSVPVTCLPASGSTFPIGTTTVNCSAADEAGNSASGSFTVAVTVETTGFYQPVDMSGILNTVKGGSTVPLKFEVFGDKSVPSTEITSTSIVKSFKTAKIACDNSSAEDAIEVVSTGGTTLRYDSTAEQFIQNWQTPKKPGECHKVTLTLMDDSAIQALFKLK